MAALMFRDTRKVDRLLRAAIWGGAICLLMLPAIAMRFTTEVDWGPEDFTFMGLMLAAAGGACEFVLRMSSNWTYRIAFAMAIGTAFLMVWSNLAVGIIGNESNPANLMYFGVLALLILGTIVARAAADGMTQVLAVTAIAFASASIAADVFGMGRVPWIMIAIFVALFSASAALFHRAAEQLGGSAG